MAIAGFVVAGMLATGSLAVPLTSSSSSTSSTSSTTSTTTVPGNEGCSPGFWKNAPKNHPGAYPTTGVTPTTTLASVGFNVNASITFDSALNNGGGGVDALLRQAAAAYLNAASTGVNYPIEPASAVVSLVNTALAGGSAAIDSLEQTLDQNNDLEGPFC